MNVYKIDTVSKSDYLYCLRVIDSLDLERISACGDDWHCEFEITFRSNAIPHTIMELGDRINIRKIK